MLHLFAKPVLLLLLGILTACSGQNSDMASKKSEPKKSESKSGSDKKKRDRSTVVAGYVVKPISYQQSRLGIGTLIPAEQVEVRSETAGKVVRIAFREGQRVSTGTLLVQLEDSELRAHSKRLQAKVDLLRGMLERKKKQHDIQALSTQDLESAQADLTIAEAELELNSHQIAKTAIRAPISGMLGLRSVSPGSYVSTGQVLTTVIQTHPLRVEFMVSSESAPYAQIGDTVLVNWSQGQSMARIDATEGVLQASSRNMKVRATLQQKLNLVPGSAVDVSLVGKATQAFRVPPDALSGNAQGPVIYLLKNGKATEVPVAVGVRTESHVQILKGVHEGDTVLCIGGQSVSPGTKVEIAQMRE